MSSQIDSYPTIPLDAAQEAIASLRAHKATIQEAHAQLARRVSELTPLFAGKRVWRYGRPYIIASLRTDSFFSSGNVIVYGYPAKQDGTVAKCVRSLGVITALSFEPPKLSFEAPK